MSNKDIGRIKSPLDSLQINGGEEDEDEAVRPEGRICEISLDIQHCEDKKKKGGENTKELRRNEESNFQI